MVPGNRTHRVYSAYLKLESVFRNNAFHSAFCCGIIEGPPRVASHIPGLVYEFPTSEAGGAHILFSIVHFFEVAI